MIASKTIQHNGDRTYDISFTLLSHNEENDQKVRFRDLKCRNEAQNQNLREKLNKTGPVEIFWVGQSQWSTVKVNGLVKSTVNGWRVMTWQCDLTLGLTWQYVKQSRRVWARGGHVSWRVRDTDGVWRREAARAREAESSAVAWGRV